MSAAPWETDPDAWDVLLFGDATGADLDAMRTGCHYNYRTQEWRDGHDHAHLPNRGAYDLSVGLVFCGADIKTCAHAPR